MARTQGSHQLKPGRQDARGNAWRSMRILRRFTSAQIETAAPIAHDNAARFIKQLLTTGYLRLDQKRIPGRPASYNVYVLARNSGPLCPICWTDGRVHDPNLDKTFDPVRT